MSLSCERFRDLRRFRSALAIAPLGFSSFFRSSASSAGLSMVTSGPVGQSASFFLGLGGLGAALGVGAGVGVGVGAVVAAALAVAEGALSVFEGLSQPER